VSRTTSIAVSEIIEVDTSISLTPFINTASAMVTKHCAELYAYTDEELELIERYLAAHFYTLRDPRPTQETAGKVNQWLQSKVDLGLATSHYGQMAMVLDYNGGLSKLNTETKKGGKRTVGISWLGTENEELADELEE